MTVATGLPRTAEVVTWLDERTQHRGIVDGVQLCVLRRSEPLVDIALGVDGTRRPVHERMLGQFRCAVAKPLLGLTVGSLVAEGACSWDTPIGSILDGPMHRAVAVCTLDDLLCHRAGLHGIPGMLMNLLPPAERLARAASTPPPAGWRRGVDSAYSESAGALLIGAAIEAMTGRGYDEVVHERVLGPSGISPDHLQFRMTDETFDRCLDSIGVASAEVEGMHVPFLVEATRQMATEWNPSWSGYATARGLAELFGYVMDLALGRAANAHLPAPVVREVLWARDNESGGHHQSDEFLMGRGVHHDLRIIGIPRAHAAATFGHFGYGVAVGFADRDLDLSVGLRFTDQHEGAVQLMRIERVVSAIYEDVTGERAVVL